MSPTSHSDSKRCPACGRQLPLSDFYVRKSGRPYTKCKSCISREVRLRHMASPDVAFEKSMQSCKRHPDRRHALAVVNAAMSAGRIQPPEKCQCCGRTSDQAILKPHHTDDGRPLDFIWICSECRRRVMPVLRSAKDGESIDQLRKRRRYEEDRVKRAMEFYRNEGRARDGQVRRKRDGVHRLAEQQER